MNNEKSIVITTYGCNERIDKIAISLFDNSQIFYSKNGNAQTYCDMMNSLEIGGDSWVFAKLVPQNTPFSLNIMIPFNFPKLLLSIDNRAIQKILREVDMKDLAIAIKGCSDIFLEKVFKNVSSRVLQALKQEMEYANSVQKQEIMNKRDKILSVVRRLEDTGEISLILKKG